MSDTTATREAILNRIRSANHQYSSAARAQEYESIERNYQQAASMDRVHILHTFIDRLREYDAHVVEASAPNLPAAIAHVLHERNQKSAAVAADFPESSLPEGFHWQHEASLSMLDLSRMETAISACEVAIAHTGTIIVKAMRQLTLLPDRYLCVVREGQIVETVPEAIVALDKISSEPLTFISGPSATADIEMTRIRGVHGPRFLDVIIVKD